MRNVDVLYYLFNCYIVHIFKSPCEFQRIHQETKTSPIVWNLDSSGMIPFRSNQWASMSFS
jgi:hypothetical protein